MLRTTSFNSYFLGLTILLCLGCTAPTLTSRVIEQDSSWFVRLDSHLEAGSASPRYDHPIVWRDEDLSAILSRLILQERVGLMDNARPPRSVFSLEEINLLIPTLRKSFQEATSHEWIVFMLVGQQGTGTETTSGGMFVEGGKLHLVIANHRLALAENSEEHTRVRANPLHSVQGSGGALAFDSPRFVIGTKANWSGGHRASASELILDHTAFLSSLQRTGSAAAPVPVRGSHAFATAPEADTSRLGSSNSVQVDSEQIILRLREEIERLKQQLADQASEVDRLKGREIRSTPTP